MFCPNCGKPVGPGARVCGNCGKPLPVQSNPQEPVQNEVRQPVQNEVRQPVQGSVNPPKKNKKLVIGIVAGLAAVLVVVMILVTVFVIVPAIQGKDDDDSVFKKPEKEETTAATDHVPSTEGFATSEPPAESVPAPTSPTSPPMPAPPATAGYAEPTEAPPFDDIVADLMKRAATAMVLYDFNELDWYTAISTCDVVKDYTLQGFSSEEEFLAGFNEYYEEDLKSMDGYLAWFPEMMDANLAEEYGSGYDLEIEILDVEALDEDAMADVIDDVEDYFAYYADLDLSDYIETSRITGMRHYSVRAGISGSIGSDSADIDCYMIKIGGDWAFFLDSDSWSNYF